MPWFILHLTHIIDNISGKNVAFSGSCKQWEITPDKTFSDAYPWQVHQKPERSMLKIWSYLLHDFDSWWRHQNGNIIRVTGHLCGESAQGTVPRSFEVFFYLRLDKLLSKQWWGWWFKPPSHPLWRHCNGELPQGRRRIMSKLFSVPESIYAHVDGLSLLASFRNVSHSLHCEIVVQRYNEASTNGTS